MKNMPERKVALVLACNLSKIDGSGLQLRNHRTIALAVVSVAGRAKAAIEATPSLDDALGDFILSCDGFRRRHEQADYA